jgi:predicted TIM-barrel fold metal-dependent hydrolase
MIVDGCAYLGDWPTYELRYRDAAGLLRLMDRTGIDAACVSLAGGMFFYDARQANERLVREIEDRRDRLWPVGTLDLTVPTWREDLEDGLGRLGLAGYRLHPAYHGYAPDAPEAVALAEQLALAGRPLFLALYVDEERFQHAAIRVPEVTVAQITSLIERAPQTTIVLNGLRTAQARQLFEAKIDLGRVYLDVNAMDQDFEGLLSLVRDHGIERLIFGSQIPFLYPEAARMVVEYSGLSEREIEAILEGNWRASPVLAGMSGRIGGNT